MLEYRISEDYAGVRLDKFLKKTLATVPTSHLFKMIRVKKVRVNGKRAKPEQELAAGRRGHRARRREAAQGRRSPARPRARRRRSTCPQLHVLYEDDWMMVIDKPSGMAVHTGSGITGGTVVDLVRAYLGPKAVRNDFAASPAHRLDRETSGVIVVAKRRPAMVHFTDVFTHHKAKKRYLVLVKGHLPRPSGLIDVALAGAPADPRVARAPRRQPAGGPHALPGGGQSGRTCAYVECVIETGRTHQIRRHFAAIGHPVVGDPKHGDFAFNREAKARWGLTRLFLHAERLEFPHPEDARSGCCSRPPCRTTWWRCSSALDLESRTLAGRRHDG